MYNLSDKPLVSVVIPCYKHQAFLERCLNSVAQQTYENIEVVIVDDCSPDDSVIEITRLTEQIEWKLRFPRVTKFYPFARNQGAHNAINYGIANSSGEMIALLNSDDMFHPERIRLMVKQIQQGKHEFVFSGVQYIDAEDQNITHFNPRATIYYRAQQNIRRFPSVGFACLTFNIAISTGNFLFTRSLFERVGQFNQYLYCHDWDFLLRSLIYTEPLFLDQELYYYRFHGVNTFESLHEIGPKESRSLLENYFALTNSRWTPNSNAPSKLNWPGFFEQFIRWYDLERFQEFAN